MDRLEAHEDRLEAIQVVSRLTVKGSS